MNTFFTEHLWTTASVKNLNISRTERAFNMKWKTFFIILTELSMIQIKAAFLDGGSLTLILIYLEIFLAQKIWAMYKAFHLQLQM